MSEIRLDLRESLSSVVFFLLVDLMELFKAPSPGSPNNSLPKPNTPALGLMRALTRSKAFSQDCVAPLLPSDAAKILSQLLASMPVSTTG